MEKLSSGKYYIKKISFSPVRFALYVNDKIYLTLGGATFKHFFGGTKVASSKTEVSKYFSTNTSLIDSIEKFEEQVLVQEMFTYLSRQETSPRKLEQWLLNRNVSPDKCKELIIQAQKQDFLNLGRYIAWEVDKREITGQRPWWWVEKKLKIELSRYDYLLSPDSGGFSTFFESYRFNDLEVLKKNFNPSPALKNDYAKLKRYLLSKGFDFSVVNEYLEYLYENK